MSLRPIKPGLLAAEGVAGAEGVRIHRDLIQWLRDIILGIPERLIATPTKTSDYTIRPWDLVLLDATDGGFSVTLPGRVSPGTEVGFLEVGGSANNVVVFPGTGDTVMGAASVTLNTANEGYLFIYDTLEKTWRIL